MTEISRLIRSFGHALRGIAGAVASERNMRIHVSAVAVVALFGLMAHLSAVHWCVVFLCCMVVVSLELVNTALEALCDQVTTDYHPAIRTAKDAAAGAVLISAAGSVGVALFLLFGDTHYIGSIGISLRQELWPRIVLPVAAVICLIFIFLPSYLQKRNEKEE